MFDLPQLSAPSVQLHLHSTKSWNSILPWLDALLKVPDAFTSAVCRVWNHQTTDTQRWRTQKRWISTILHTHHSQIKFLCSLFFFPLITVHPKAESFQADGGLKVFHRKWEATFCYHWPQWNQMTKPQCAKTATRDSTNQECAFGIFMPKWLVIFIHIYFVCFFFTVFKYKLKYFCPICLIL